MKTGETRPYLDGALTVTRRRDDYHACITGHPEYWGCGKSIDDALADITKIHGDAIAAFQRTGQVTEKSATQPTVIEQMTHDEIAEALDEIRETNFDALSIGDNAVFHMYIHAVRAKDPKHDHAHCEACSYYNFTGLATQEATHGER